MKCTVDASVFVAAARAIEPHFTESSVFLDRLRANSVEIICPAIVLAECAGAIARRSGDPGVTREVLSLIDEFPGILLTAISRVRSRRAAEIALTQQLRGADSLYVAIAAEFNATLVTWDNEMLQRGAAIVQTMTPSQWLAQFTDASDAPT